MVKLENLAKQKPQLTSQQLRSLLGQPCDPCLWCGSAILAVLHTGEIVCAFCGPDLNGQPPVPRTVAFEGIVLMGEDGVPRLYDHREEQGELEQYRQLRFNVLDRPAGHWRVLALRDHTSGPRPSETVDEWVGRLPDPRVKKIDLDSVEFAEIYPRKSKRGA